MGVLWSIVLEGRRFGYKRPLRILNQSGYAVGDFMMVIIHKACHGPAVESDTVVAESCALPVTDFPFTCFTCLDEIMDASELRLSEEIRM